MRATTIAMAVLASILTAAVARADRPDPWITAKVKMKLLTDADVSGSAVNVDTTDGRVTLHGIVDTAEQKAEAERYARGIEGVREVRNLLTVVPTAQQARASVRDKAIEKQVDARLQADPALAGSQVKVKSVENGVVLLSGEAATLHAHRRSIELARGCDGVRKVASSIESPDSLSDIVIWREGRREVRRAALAEDPGAWDSLITAKVKAKMLVSTSVDGLAISVDSRDGVVTLFGTVPDAAAGDAAERMAVGTDGVVRTVNQLQVVPEEEARATQRRDEAAEQRVKTRFEQRSLLSDARIEVDVRDGVARLTGTVPNEHARLEAILSARTTDGIRRVIDGMEPNGKS